MSEELSHIEQLIAQAKKAKKTLINSSPTSKKIGHLLDILKKSPNIEGVYVKLEETLENEESINPKIKESKNYQTAKNILETKYSAILATNWINQHYDKEKIETDKEFREICLSYFKAAKIGNESKLPVGFDSFTNRLIIENLMTKEEVLGTETFKANDYEVSDNKHNVRYALKNRLNLQHTILTKLKTDK